MRPAVIPLARPGLSLSLRAVAGLLLLAGGAPTLATTGVATAHPARAAVGTLAAGQQPLYFEPNLGQTNAQVRFLAHGQGYTLFLTDQGAVFRLASSGGVGGTVVRETLVGAQAHPVLVGQERLAGRVSYLLGHAHLPRWANHQRPQASTHTNIPTYAQVVYMDVYPGIDEVFYSQGGQLEYDFVVHPGANPSAIRLRVTGAAVRLGTQGDLLLGTTASTLAQRAPMVYQQGVGSRVRVAGHYRLLGQGTVGFALASYDRSRPLVIDPLVYSTYLGGSGNDVGTAVTVDGDGNAYVTGSTTSSDFPVTNNAEQNSQGGSGTDAFVAKLSNDGSTLVYATYLGGSGYDAGTGIAVDSNGDAFISGNTSSSDFPATSNAVQTSYGGGGSDAFVAELNTDGSSLDYATYVGGARNDTSGGIAVDGDGNAYVVGTTASTDFPVTSNAYDTTYSGGGSDAFVAKLNTDGSSLVYATYLGGSRADKGNAIAVDDTGNAYVTGDTASGGSTFRRSSNGFYYGGGSSDAFAARLNQDGSDLFWSTYLGGSGTDHGRGIALNNNGMVLVTGDTSSTNFSVSYDAVQRRSAGYGDVFLAELSPSNRYRYYATYLGGSGNDGAHAIVLDSAGNVYITGGTDSRNLRTTPGAVQRRYGGGGDAFLFKLRSDGKRILYASYLGGSSAEEGNGIAVDTNDQVYVTGYTRSYNFRTTDGAEQASYDGGSSDAFVTSVTVP